MPECPQCGYHLDPFETECPRCARQVAGYDAPLAPIAPPCPNCQAAVPPDKPFCPHCGHAMQPVAPTVWPPPLQSGPPLAPLTPPDRITKNKVIDFILGIFASWTCQGLVAGLAAVLGSMMAHISSRASYGLGGLGWVVGLGVPIGLYFATRRRAPSFARGALLSIPLGIVIVIVVSVLLFLGMLAVCIKAEAHN